MIITLFAVVFNHLFGSVSTYVAFLPDISVTMIVGIALFPSVIGLGYLVGISNQVLRIINGYSSRLEKILSVTRDLSITSSEARSILLLDNGALVFKIVRGEKKKALTGTSVEKGKGITGWVAETGMPAPISNAAQDRRLNHDVAGMTGYETRTILCVPLKTNSAVVGVLGLLNKSGGFSYRERDEEIITHLAEQAAISIIKARFFMRPTRIMKSISQRCSLRRSTFRYPKKRTTQEGWRGTAISPQGPQHVRGRKEEALSCEPSA